MHGNRPGAYTPESFTPRRRGGLLGQKISTFQPHISPGPAAYSVDGITSMSQGSGRNTGTKGGMKGAPSFSFGIRAGKGTHPNDVTLRSDLASTIDQPFENDTLTARDRRFGSHDCNSGTWCLRSLATECGHDGLWTSLLAIIQDHIAQESCNSRPRRL